MKTFTFYCSDMIREKLIKESEEKDIKTSELIRRILDNYFEQKEKQGVK